MTFWILLTAMSCAATVALTVPLVRRFESRSGRGENELAVYRRQLAEVDEEGARGDLSAEEMAAARAEIGRRALAAEKRIQPTHGSGSLWQKLSVAAVVVAVVGGGIAIYRFEGRPDLATSAADAVDRLAAATARSGGGADGGATAGGQTPAGQQADNVDSMAEKLARRLSQQPNDPEGWRMLGWSYFSTQRYGEAAVAFAMAAELEPANADYKASHAEALIQADGGEVSEPAMKLVDAALALDPGNLRARFYKALGTEQAGDLDAALPLWSALLRNAPADAGWAGVVRNRITGIGQKLGKDVSAMLAPVPPSPASEPSAPAAEPPAAAGEATSHPGIDDMVAGLAARLETSPMDVEGWSMLIRAYMVMGRREDAASALARARLVFAGAPVMEAQLSAMAESVGLGQAQASQPSGAGAPDEQQAAAIRALPGKDQQAMIVAMVERLADKLKANPRDPEGWLKLIRSRLVLQQRQQADSALQSALEALAGDEAGLETVRSGARQLGVAIPN